MKLNATSKEIAVLCNLYLQLMDGESAEEALDRILMMVDSDLGVNIHNYELREI